MCLSFNVCMSLLAIRLAIEMVKGIPVTWSLFKIGKGYHCKTTLPYICQIAKPRTEYSSLVRAGNTSCTDIFAINNTVSHSTHSVNSSRCILLKIISFLFSSKFLGKLRFSQTVYLQVPFFIKKEKKRSICSSMRGPFQGRTNTTQET